jgi:hypothetical protein
VVELLRGLERAYPAGSGWVLDERRLVRRHIHVFNQRCRSGPLTDPNNYPSTQPRQVTQDAQISQALVLTEKMTGVPVCQLLAKMGAAGRGDMAAIAHRLALQR